MIHSSHTPTNNCHVFSSLLTCANLAPPKSVSQNWHWRQQSEIPSCYKNDRVSVSCKGNGLRPSGLQGHFLAWFIFSQLGCCKSVHKIRIQWRFPAISYACVCLPITVMSIYISKYMQNFSPRFKVSEKPNKALQSEGRNREKVYKVILWLAFCWLNSIHFSHSTSPIQSCKY